MTATSVTMSREEMRQFLREELPLVIQDYPDVRYMLIGALSETFARQTDVQAILEHLDLLREDFNRQMAEFARRHDAFEQRMEAMREDFNRQMAEFARRQDTFEQRMDAFAQRMDAFEQRMDAMREDFNRQMAEFARRQDAFEQRMDAMREDFNRQMAEFARRQDMFAQQLDEHFRRVESHIGALGSRWGLQTEDSFRAALAGILDDRLGLRVERFRQIDTEGTVFGQPEQVEIDVVVRDGVCYLLELKSSLSKADVYTFVRKVAFYERLKGVTVQRRIVISPMLRPGVLETAQALGLEVYTSAYDVAA